MNDDATFPSSHLFNGYSVTATVRFSNRTLVAEGGYFSWGNSPFLSLFIVRVSVCVCLCVLQTWLLISHEYEGSLERGVLYNINEVINLARKAPR